MTLFRVERTVPLAPDEVWRRLTDWPAHGRQVPLTRTRVLTPGPNGAGTRFTARTGIGRLAFDDPMEVVRWTPPAAGRAGLCELRKRGSVVRGRASIDVRPTGSGSHVIWVEEVRVRLLPGWGDPLLASAGRRVFGRVLTVLLEE